MLKTVSPPESGVDPQAFRDALRQFASGVTVITTRDEGGRVHGMTATAFSSLSLEPPLVLVAVARDARCHALVTRERRFGVSILSTDQMHLSSHFGGTPSPDARPMFATLDGVPVIDDAMVKLSCRLDEVVAGGDHSIFIGLVTEATSRPGEPLVHFDGRYHVVAPRPER